MTGANLAQLDLTDSNLTDPILIGAMLTSADLNYANLTGTDLVGANLVAANLSEGPHFVLLNIAIMLRSVRHLIHTVALESPLRATTLS